MRAEAPAGGQSRPPTTTVAGQSGASVSRTVRVRPTVPTRLSQLDLDGLSPDDPYVRRFWVAAIGPSAVAELLRVIRAATVGEEVQLPKHLPALIRTGLITVTDGELVVRGAIPIVPPSLRWRFPPSLAAEHSRALASRRP